MSYKFTINNEKVSVISPFKSESSIELFEENLEKTFKSELSQGDLIPPGLLYVSENSETIIFERPPRYQSIVFVNGPKAKAHHLLEVDKHVYKYDIPLPWQIYVANFEKNGTLASLKMFFSQTDLSNFNINASFVERLDLKSFYLPMLPNMYENYNFCLDNDIDYNALVNIGSRMAKAHSAIWDTVFNTDLLDLINSCLAANGDFYKEKHNQYIEDTNSFLLFWSKFSLTTILENMNIFLDIGYNIKMENNEPYLNNTKFVNAFNYVL